jgi:hypothetical protein
MAFDPTPLCGWVHDPRAQDEAMGRNDRHPIFAMANYEVKDSGKGKIRLLHKIVEQAIGSYIPLTVQTTGDCTSTGSGKIIDLIKCIQIALGGDRSLFKAVTITELIYAASRIEIGKGQLGNSPGSIGAWCMEALRKYGAIARGVYTVNGVKYDYTQYSGQLADKLGSRGQGVPDPMEAVTKEHLVHSTGLISTYEDARDSIYQGYPILVCSQVGFASTRDADGFAKPTGTWPHAMVFMAVDDEFRRPGLLCDNRTWGDTWINGPVRHEQPGGTFWVDADTVNRMLRYNDSFNASQYDGYPDQSAKLSHIVG